MALLTIKNLRTVFDTDQGTVRAVDGVSFSIERGETLGVVGESGCGKSVTALSVLRLVQKPTGRIESGEILLDGKNLLSLSDAEMRKIRGCSVSMIFQEPMTSLKRASGRSRCSTSWASPTPPRASTNTRTSSPAVNASAS